MSNMTGQEATKKATVLHQLGAKPRHEDFPAPSADDASPVIRVAAAGVHHNVLFRASGKFYGRVPPLPHVVGTDGLGFTPAGERVFFDETVGPLAPGNIRPSCRRTGSCR